jgi:Arc/MetJ family transcription regulator
VLDTFPADVLAWAGIARTMVVVFDALVQRTVRVYTQTVAEQRCVVSAPVLHRSRP